MRQFCATLLSCVFFCQDKHHECPLRSSKQASRYRADAVSRWDCWENIKSTEEATLSGLRCLVSTLATTRRSPKRCDNGT